MVVRRRRCPALPGPVSVRLPRPSRHAVGFRLPDLALLLLDDPTAQQRAILGAIHYSTNRAQLHTDETVLPRRRRARASWNYLVSPDRGHVVVSYDVSRPMHINADRRFLPNCTPNHRSSPIWLRHNGARSTGCSMRQASSTAAGFSKSAPGKASCASARPAVGPTCAR